MSAVRPTVYDIGIASEAILSAAGSQIAPIENLIAAVERRLAEEPLPEDARTLQDVPEAGVRHVRARTIAVTAIAELEARGVLLPLSTMHPDQQWNLSWRNSSGAGAYNVDEGYNYRLAESYRLAPLATLSPGTESPAVFLNQLPPGMGAKVRRTLREAVETYRTGQFFAAGVLLGIASEAAWGQVARLAAVKTKDANLQSLLANPRSSAAWTQQAAIDAVRKTLKITGVDFVSLDASEQIYRDLRNYAVHRPDDAFDETAVGRAVVGSLLAGSVAYFGRLYELMDKINAHP